MKRLIAIFASFFSRPSIFVERHPFYAKSSFDNKTAKTHDATCLAKLLTESRNVD